MGARDRGTSDGNGLDDRYEVVEIFQDVFSIMLADICLCPVCLCSIGDALSFLG